MAEDPQITLYKFSGAQWSMPSICPGCMTAEAYIKFAGVRCIVKELSVPARSPTGWLPALEDADVVVGIDSEVDGSRDEQVSASEVISHLQRNGHDLDRGLDATARAEAAAFRSLIDTKLAPAVQFCTWMDPDAFKAYTKPAYSAETPGPISWWQLTMRRRAVAAQLAAKGVSGPLAGDKVFQAADEACTALAAHLDSRQYFGGEGPSSLDAAAFPLLCFALRAPVAEGPLRDAAERHPGLRSYVARVARDWFGGEGEGVGLAAAAAAAKGGARAAKPRPARRPQAKQPPTEKELRFKQRTRLAIAFAVLSITAYVVLGEMVEARALSREPLLCKWVTCVCCGPQTNAAASLPRASVVTQFSFGFGDDEDEDDEGEE